MAENFDVKKLVTSPFTGVFWVKTIVYMMAMAFLLAVGYGVYRWYFKREITQTQHQTIGNITVNQGGHLNLGQQTTEVKRKWYIPSPFVEVYVFKEDDEDGAGIKTGARWDF